MSITYLFIFLIIYNFFFKSIVIYYMIFVQYIFKDERHSKFQFLFLRYT